MFLHSQDGELWVKEPPKHVCKPPDISRYGLEEENEQQLSTWVWRCNGCGKFYRVIEGGECMACPLWEWRRCWPWEDLRYKRMWRKAGHSD